MKTIQSTQIQTVVTYFDKSGRPSTGRLTVRLVDMDGNVVDPEDVQGIFPMVIHNYVKADGEGDVQDALDRTLVPQDPEQKAEANKAGSAFLSIAEMLGYRIFDPEHEDINTPRLVQ